MVVVEGGSIREEREAFNVHLTAGELLQMTLTQHCAWKMNISTHVNHDWAGEQTRDTKLQRFQPSSAVTLRHSPEIPTTTRCESLDLGQHGIFDDVPGTPCLRISTKGELQVRQERPAGTSNIRQSRTRTKKPRRTAHRRESCFCKEEDYHSLAWSTRNRNIRTLPHHCITEEQG